MTTIGLGNLCANLDFVTTDLIYKGIMTAL